MRDSISGTLRARFPHLWFAAALAGTPGQRKHLVRWLRSRRRSYLLDAPSPWLTFDAIDVLRDRMRDGMKVFEYGSGGSTLFWLQWSVQLVSVEHDGEWYAVVKGRLPGHSSVDYRLVPPEPYAERNLQADPADPLAYVSSDENLRGRTFRRYTSQIDEFPDAHFDIVLIDGRARPSCIHHAARKVTKGGVLVLDNADRDYYVARVEASLRGFNRSAYPGAGPCNPLTWRTDIYARPE